jgi:hypothetical protein
MVGGKEMAPFLNGEIELLTLKLLIKKPILLILSSIFKKAVRLTLK